MDETTMYALFLVVLLFLYLLYRIERRSRFLKQHHKRIKDAQDLTDKDRFAVSGNREITGRAERRSRQTAKKR